MFTSSDAPCCGSSVKYETEGLVFAVGVGVGVGADESAACLQSSVFRHNMCDCGELKRRLLRHADVWKCVMRCKRRQTSIRSSLGGRAQKILFCLDRSVFDS